MRGLGFIYNLFFFFLNKRRWSKPLRGLANVVMLNVYGLAFLMGLYITVALTAVAS
jgi:hypothetical protein